MLIEWRQVLERYPGPCLCAYVMGNHREQKGVYLVGLIPRLGGGLKDINYLKKNYRTPHRMVTNIPQGNF